MEKKKLASSVTILESQHSTTNQKACITTKKTFSKLSSAYETVQVVRVRTYTNTRSLHNCNVLHKNQSNYNHPKFRSKLTISDDSLYCMPETNLTLHVNYTGTRIKIDGK